MLRLNIRAKLTLLLIVFSMLPLAAVMPVIFNKLNEMERDTLEGMNGAADQIGETIDRNLFERYGDVQAFGTNAASKDTKNWYNFSTSNPLVASMDAYMTNYGLYKMMLLVDMDGKVAAINSTDNKGAPIDNSALRNRSFKDATWFQQAIHKKFLKSDTLDGTVVEQPHYEQVVSDVYKGEDGFVITFAAPVYDYSGSMIGVWVNFADFGLVEDIVKDVYKQKKAAGMASAAFAIGDEKGIILVNYDPTARAGLEKRESSVIGKKTLKEMDIPAAEDAIKSQKGEIIDQDQVSGEDDAVSWKKSDGAMGYPGLGWTVIMHQPAQDAFAGVSNTKHLLDLIVAGAFILIITFGILIGTIASRPLRKSTKNMQAIADGDYTTIVEGADRGDEMGEMAKAMEQLKTTLDTNTRLKQALDSVSSNVMMADENLNIVYLNESVMGFLREAEKDIQKDLPRFSVTNLMGANIDIFHKNPAHQRGMLDKMATTTKTSIQVGGRSFNLIAVPMFDQNKKRIGTTVEWQDGTAVGLAEAINRSQAIIEFQVDGTIINANENFLNVMGYNLDEIKGKHHSMFADQAYKASAEYQQFWSNLSRGEAQSGEFKRIGKGGKEVWINGSYNPIVDLKGKVVRVVKTASEVTKTKLQAVDYAGQIEAIGKSQAVISFNMDGTIIDANANFLNTLGYNLDEVKGKHHSMFVVPEYKASAEYQHFWTSLNRGEYQQAEYKRIGKGGKEVWIQASYNPIMDLNGNPFKVVKYATDVTQMVTTRTENEMGMNEAVRILTGIAAGNLTEKMELEYKGTFGQIKEAVNATVDRLYGMVKQIIEAAQSVNSAATEIASGSTDLSQRTEEQASSLEETAASMEQITGTVKQNSSNAATANELSAKANSVANDGGKVVEEAVTAMGSIEKSSKKISDIIGVIDEIAFQTNLLALNAAVEAARAGDAGKGFAVVASEVRSLAGRSASASKEIKALINESATQVQSGAALVNEAGETLKNIVASVKQVSGIVSEIANASQEQATGIDEINTAITQMDEVTQQNAALVEENTAAATSMVEQARELEKLMSFFTISDDGHEEESEHPNVVALKSAKPVAGKVKPSPVKAAARPAAKPAKVASSKAGYADDWKEF